MVKKILNWLGIGKRTQSANYAPGDRVIVNERGTSISEYWDEASTLTLRPYEALDIPTLYQVTHVNDIPLSKDQIIFQEQIKGYADD